MSALLIVTKRDRTHTIQYTDELTDVVLPLEELDEPPVNCTERSAGTIREPTEIIILRQWNALEYLFERKVYSSNKEINLYLIDVFFWKSRLSESKASVIRCIWFSLCVCRNPGFVAKKNCLCTGFAREFSGGFVTGRGPIRELILPLSAEFKYTELR